MTRRPLPRRLVVTNDTTFDAAVLGEGQPTVVFVNGLGAPLEEWSLVAPVIAQRCRVVCYDRRIAPPSGQIPMHDAAHAAADLQALLDALAVTGPLILVGHSWGGALIRRYAADHADTVVGMVFIDASHEKIKGMRPTRLSRALYTSSTYPLRITPVRRRLLRMLGFGRLTPAEFATVNALPWLANGRTSRAEFRGVGPSLSELERIAPSLPNIPIQVLLAGGRGLTARLGSKQIAAIKAVWENAVDGRSEISLRVVPHSGHYISLDQSQVVIAAIDDVIHRASSRPSP